LEIHKAARKHGIKDADIRHAVRNALVSYEVENDDGPLRILHIGPDGAGNLLEVVVLEFDDGGQLAIHAMRLREKYEGLLS